MNFVPLAYDNSDRGSFAEVVITYRNIGSRRDQAQLTDLQQAQSKTGSSRRHNSQRIDQANRGVSELCDDINAEMPFVPRGTSDTYTDLTESDLTSKLSGARS
jgi:hypothetical protein